MDAKREVPNAYIVNSFGDQIVGASAFPCFETTDYYYSHRVIITEQLIH